MECIRSVRRFVPWTDWRTGPTAREAIVRLTHGNLQPADNFNIQTPWACFHAQGGIETTEEDLARNLPGSYATAEEAEAEANRRCPHFHAKHNQTINGRLDDSIRWQDDFMGPNVLADYVGVTREDLYKIARGVIKATKKMADGALEYHGQRCYGTNRY